MGRKVGATNRRSSNSAEFFTLDQTKRRGSADVMFTGALHATRRKPTRTTSSNLPWLASLGRCTRHCMLLVTFIVRMSW